MPPERHSSPPPRPARDRHTGPGFGGGGQRRGFSAGGFGGGSRERGPRPPFTPRPPFQPAEPAQSVRLREGEREIEVHGSAAFVRQILEELPALLARLRGEAAPLARPASISMPPPPRHEAPAAVDNEPDIVDAEIEDEFDDEDEEDDEELPPARASHRRQRHTDAAGPAHPRPEPRGRSEEPAPPARAGNAKPAPRAGGRSNGKLSLEDRVFGALEHADHPLSVAAIRKQIGGDSSGQQIRRILERASDRVIATDERPAAYALR